MRRSGVGLQEQEYVDILRLCLAADSANCGAGSGGGASGRPELMADTMQRLLGLTHCLPEKLARKVQADSPLQNGVWAGLPGLTASFVRRSGLRSTGGPRRRRTSPPAGRVRCAAESSARSTSAKKSLAALFLLLLLPP